MSNDLTYTYEWANEDHSMLVRNGPKETDYPLWIPADPLNSDYAYFLASEATAAEYVAPPPPEPLSTEEKVNAMLEAFDLTREEMQAALDAKTPKVGK